MEISFCDLRAKEVVNICDGKLLGNIVDLVFDSCSARITGIVVPGERNFFSFFKNNQDIFRVSKDYFWHSNCVIDDCIMLWGCV